MGQLDPERKVRCSENSVGSHSQEIALDPESAAGTGVHQDVARRIGGEPVALGGESAADLVAGTAGDPDSGGSLAFDQAALHPIRIALNPEGGGDELREDQSPHDVPWAGEDEAGRVKGQSGADQVNGSQGIVALWIGVGGGARLGESVHRNGIRQAPEADAGA